MKLGLLWVSLLITGAVSEELVAKRIGELTVPAPKDWNRTMNEGSTRFAHPSGEAYFEVTTGKVQTPNMAAGVCLGKILDGLGNQGWEREWLDGPAAMKRDVDTDDKGQQFVTETVVGCNGKTTFSIEFHMVGAKKDHYVALADRIMAGIQYAK